MIVLRNVFVLLLLTGLAAVSSEAASVTRAFQQVKDSVVTITTSQDAISKEGQVVSEAGIGSGVLVSKDGKILTAAHVVQVAKRLRVEFTDGTKVRAKVISSEPVADVALIQADEVPRGVVVANLGDSDRMQIGDEVFVVGAPYGLSHTLTVGHVSARHEPYSLPGAPMAELFQTDAAINKGNSGGPMFSLDGDVIGIVSHIFSMSGGYEGLGFAATSNTARKLLLERDGFWGGLDAFSLSGDLAAALNVPQEAAALVQHVAPDSPGERLGLRGGTVSVKMGEQTLLLGGDIILEAMGISMAEEGSYPRIRDALAGISGDEKLTVKVLRGGKIVQLSTTVAR